MLDIDSHVAEMSGHGFKEFDVEPDVPNHQDVFEFFEFGYVEPNCVQGLCFIHQRDELGNDWSAWIDGEDGQEWLRRLYMGWKNSAVDAEVERKIESFRNRGLPKAAGGMAKRKGAPLEFTRNKRLYV